MENKKNEVVVKDLGQKAVTNMLNQVMSFAQLENSYMSQKDKEFAVSTIQAIQKQISASNTSWNQLDIAGCQLPKQIKRIAKLGLDREDNDFYIDIRNNSKTGLKDINLKLQYQGEKKLLVKFCKKKIVDFIEDVVCVGDNFKTKRNFRTGQTEVLEHDYANSDDTRYRNKLENITQAYVIAYVENENTGELTPYTVIIDKARIERAYNSAQTKNIWNMDTRKMVIKTAYHELKAKLAPFMNYPSEIKKDLEEQEIEVQRNYVDAEYNEVRDTQTKETGTVELPQVEAPAPTPKQEQPKQERYDFYSGQPVVDEDYQEQPFPESDDFDVAI